MFRKRKRKNKGSCCQKPSKNKFGGLSEAELMKLCDRIMINDNYNGVVASYIKHR